VKWQRKAAEQGYADAQLLLGLLYSSGKGVPQDFVQARMWLSLAAVAGSTAASSILNLYDTKMTPNQIAEANRLAREWRPRKP